MDDKLKLDMLNDYRQRNGWPKLDSLEAKDPRAVPKLSHDEQCEIKAFCYLGVPKKMIAAVFGVHHHTVIRINSANFKKYPKVFAAAMSYNTQWDFCRKYLTPKRVEEMRALWPRLDWSGLQINDDC